MSRREHPRRPFRIAPLLALASASCLGAVSAAWLLGGVGLVGEQPLLAADIDEMPLRFASLEEAPGEPARVVHLPSIGAPSAPARGAERASELDRSLAESAGVMGALAAAELGGALSGASGLSSGVGGLGGGKGVALGGGGLGRRGSGGGGGAYGSVARELDASSGSSGTADLTESRGSAADPVPLPEPLEQRARERGLLQQLVGTRGEQAHGDLGSEHYTDWGLNEMTLSESDALSTFSIDVDTASYAISRRKLRSGYLPPASAVRVEEFVNYLPYDYAAPRGAPFAVHMEAAPNPYQPGHHLLRVGLKGRELDQAHRAPVRLTFLVDVSGSMSSQDKLGLAQEALHFLVRQLGPEDSVAIATYAGRVQRVLDPTPTTRRSRIHAAIDGLSSGGSTAMSSGIDLAYRMASEAYVDGAENRVVVLSDGDANVGPASHTQILGLIEGHAGRGISLSTVGFGMGNYKDTLMEQLADKGDGNYHYVDSMFEAEKVFGVDLASTLQTIARDVKIQVQFDPEVVLAYRLVGYENRDLADRDFRDDAVDAGEVGSGHRVTALYDVVLAADREAARLATVRLRAKPPGPDAPASEWSTGFERGALRAEFELASADFRLAAGAAGFAEKLRGSRYLEEVSYRDVAEIVRGAMRPWYEEDGELLELVGQAAELSGEGRLALR